MRDLERELVELGDQLAVPSGADLVHRVLSELAKPPASPWRRRLVIAAAALAAGIAGLTAAPVVADWLGVKGVEIRQQPPPTTTPGVGTTLDLGAPVDRTDAQRRAGFRLLEPRELGPPDEVWLDNRSGVDVVTYLYRARPDLPGGAAPGIGALFSQARVDVDDGLIATKFAEGNTTVESVSMGTGRAFWVAGAHYVAFNDRRGGVIAARLRVADNVLLWERGDVTVRLETTLGRDATIRIAQTSG